MIVCPNCNHPNPPGAVQCEACYTPLPVTALCPNCGAIVQIDANFCGQCGFNLLAQTPMSTPNSAGVQVPPTLASFPGVFPDLQAAESVVPEPLVLPDPLVLALPDLESPEEELSAVAAIPPPATPEQEPLPLNPELKTQLQLQSARLLHVQTNTTLDIPPHLTVIHIGKPNDRVPPDIDVAGFAHSDVVSRIHADIRYEGDTYYIEDVGSANGTYINNIPLPSGNRHRLRPGDRISLGKGDLVTFLFQVS
ncbi:hypothetical protein DO97_01735 [Neosynechococcus sphagnicola sy1]|uniref:FHA domain-containing protein n=1 Tax=Neosynechococcus sphagnicola sy1 TaxID=1497020 RepID=A0A098TLG7_9CYAN|nr:FHA domain-containing protein [Neosynechococcus sphagnicola]KGF73091.1 hypothetical protein DO97_01735 [Neosynechococcus sphagnicola sy1]